MNVSLFKLSATLAAGCVVAIGLAVQSASAAEVKIVCAHDQPVTPGNEGYKEIQWQYFKKAVEERSKGRIEVQVIGAGQLGDSPQLVEGMKIGTVDCTDISGASAGPFIPPMQLAAVPYLVESIKHRDRLIAESGPFYAEMKKLVWDYLKAHTVGANTASVRSVYNSKKPIKSPDDLVGLKIRTMQSPAQVKSWKALGAVASALPFAEVYAGLQSGVIDGAENSPMFLWGMKHHEVTKYYSKTNHLINIGFVFIHDRAFQKIPADLRDMVLKAGSEACAAARKYDNDVDEKFLDQITKAGVVINEVDPAPFVAKITPVHEELAKEYKAENLLKIIRDEAAKARAS